MDTSKADEKLRKEFNEWAAAGRGEEMERHHISIAEQTIARMAPARGERVLDLGCGAGWATRILARAVAGKGEKGQEGQAVGIDISDDMIARARAASRELENIMFVWGSAQEIPWRDEYFDKVLSIESFYYYAEQEPVLRELLRVLVPGGRLFILINLYKENHYSLRWVEELAVPVHARSENEYTEMLRQAGFEDVQALRIPDLTPTPDEYSGQWFKNAEELRDFKRIGALLLLGRRPAKHD
ncbi:MAG TPA: methyltransferase domain-containing protein [Clostridia bacterium]|nr:methyltransferase domain-containing protein [Clostridia bacterium]